MNKFRFKSGDMVYITNPKHNNCLGYVYTIKCPNCVIDNVLTYATMDNGVVFDDEIELVKNKFNSGDTVRVVNISHYRNTNRGYSVGDIVKISGISYVYEGRVNYSIKGNCYVLGEDEIESVDFPVLNINIFVPLNDKKEAYKLVCKKVEKVFHKIDAKANRTKV